jgi:S-formylglutathione hydrolase FrmB
MSTAPANGPVVALRLFRRGAGALAVVLSLVLGPGAMVAPARGTDAAPRPDDRADFGLTLLDETRTGERMTELTFRTDALAEPTHVRILLPTDYAETRRRYPVVYLLHGAADDYRSWVDKGNADELTAELPVIVVMPDGGQGGFYSDWYNHGDGGPPQWETYHIEQLLPWVDAHYRTVPDRGGRAVVGLSMGGFGAMSYAARHPDLFTSVASFSGAVDTNTAPIEGSPLDGGTPGSTWGPRPTEEVRWRAHNPWDLAGNLRGLQVTLRTGNGLPGGDYGGGDPVETACWRMSSSMHERLDSLDVPHVWDDYGPGSHTWPYWERDLRRTLPDLMAAFENPPGSPARFAYRAVEPSYRVFGWRVRLHRAALEFSRLHHAGVRGFRLTGSGTADVTTAASYAPGATYRVVATGPHDRTNRVLRADRLGRLHVPVVLGPANEFQEYTAEAEGSGSRKYTVAVTIRHMTGS